MIRVVIPFHLRNLARIDGEVKLEIEASGDGRAVTIGGVLDALEEKHPVLRGTIREHGTLARRPFLRYFACEKDWSLLPPETRLPEAVCNGSEPFIVLGSIAGG